MKATFALLVLLGVALPGCKKDGCDKDNLDRLLGAVKKESEANRPELVAQGLLEFCGTDATPMPPALRKGLLALREWEPHIATMKIIEAVREDLPLWTKVCAAGGGAFDSEILRSRFAALELTRACKGDQHGFASEVELGTAPLSATVLSLTAFAWLSESGTDKVRAHRLARGLLGQQ